MILKIPKSLIEWVNSNWLELVSFGGLESVEYRVVKKLPFNSKARAMVWKGVVLVREDWISPALNDLSENSEISLKHIWAIPTLVFHEPLHVISQRKGPSWPLWLARYVLHWFIYRGYRNIPEEVLAFGNEKVMGKKWYDEIGKNIIGHLIRRPS